MADVQSKFPALSELTSLATDDLLVASDTSANNVAKRITKVNLITTLGIDLKAPIADPTFTGEIGIGSVNVSEAELGILEGATLSTTELNYVDGVTSAIQTQLNAKGTGDVVGPGSATDNAIARYNTTTGKLIQDSDWLIADGGNMSIAVDYAGLMGTFIENTNSDAINVAGAITQLKNDEGYWSLLGMTSSASTIGGGAFQNTLHLYNQGYGDSLYTVDGAEDHVWYTDPTDSHNFSALSNEVMRLTSAGDLSLSGGSINIPTGETYQINGSPISAVNIPITDAGSYYDGTEVESATQEVGKYMNFFNGSFQEPFNALVTSDGATITLSIQSKASGDLTMRFSDGLTTLDCTPAATIALTAGTASSPQANYIYIPQSTKTITKSTTGFPTAAEHIKIGYFLCQTAAYVQADGALINQNWNDEIEGSDNQGHMLHMAERSRRDGAYWFSGVDPNGTSGYLTISAGTVRYKSAAGVIMQMHSHSYPAKDTSGSDDIHIVNWNGDAYHATQNLHDIVADSTGASLSGRWFGITVWGVANKGGEYGPVMVNLPSGSYNTAIRAKRDANGYANFTMPREFNKESSTGFLIAHLIVQQGATWGYNSYVDLRGMTPQSATGGALGAVTQFPDNTFEVYDESDNTKVLAFQASGITTGNTRTMTIPDNNGTIITSGNLTDVTTVGTVTSGTLSTGAVLADVTMTLGSDADGDVYYRSSNKLTRLAKGTADQVLTMNSGATAPEWANSSAGFTDPMTTRGDIIYKNSSGTTTRLGAGTANQVLTSDGTDISWEDASGGSAERWTTWTGASRTDDSTISSTTHLDIGTPIRYKATAGTYRYGQVKSLSTNAHTIFGVKCTASDDDVFEYGTPDMIDDKMVISDPGSWADGADTALLENDLLIIGGIISSRPTSYLIGYRASGDQDTGANNPRVNMTVDGDAVCTTNTNAGIEPDTTFVDTGTDIDNTNYEISYGSLLEATTDANGSNNDAKNLTLIPVILTP